MTYYFKITSSHNVVTVFQNRTFITVAYRFLPIHYHLCVVFCGRVVNHLRTGTGPGPTLSDLRTLKEVCLKMAWNVSWAVCDKYWVIGLFCKFSLMKLISILMTCTGNSSWIRSASTGNWLYVSSKKTRIWLRMFSSWHGKLQLRYTLNPNGSFVSFRKEQHLPA